MKQVWCSSDLDRPIISLTIRDCDGDGLNGLVVKEGQYRKIDETHYNIIKQHPMFAPLLSHVQDYRYKNNLCPEDGWAVITRNGYLHVHPTRRGDPQEWVYVIAHCLLHLGLGHFQDKADRMKWNTAGDCFIARFLADMKLGCAPADLLHTVEFSAPSEERLYNDFIEKGIPPSLSGFGTAGLNSGDMVWAPEKNDWSGRKINWRAVLLKVSLWQ